jgi:hypothetical protein
VGNRRAGGYSDDPLLSSASRKLPGMGWTLAQDWLSVVGLILLTFGTGAQALANLAEFKSLQASISKAAHDAIKDSVDDRRPGSAAAQR